MACYELKPLSSTDGMDVYEFLQGIPAEENGFMNSAAGLTYDAYKQWLVRQEAIKPIAAAKGIDRMLVTVHNDNIASIRTAVKCGGKIVRISDVRHYVEVPCN